MLFLAKAALGLGATLALSSAYVFHEGLITVDVDEQREGGSHVHLWVPGTAVSVAMRFIPRENFAGAVERARPHLPLLRELAKQLQKYPNADLVEVADETDHVHITTKHGKFQIDATGTGGVVHVTVPLAVMEDVVDRLEDLAHDQ
jgi:hypothetical protein